MAPPLDLPIEQAIEPQRNAHDQVPGFFDISPPGPEYRLEKACETLNKSDIALAETLHLEINRLSRRPSYSGMGNERRQTTQHGTDRDTATVMSATNIVPVHALLELRCQNVRLSDWSHAATAPR